MVLAGIPEAIEALRHASTRDQALKQLKNSIIGHDQRKELAVRHGILEVLLDTCTRSDEARVQATLILGSLANAGARYVTPMLAAGVPGYLLEVLGWQDSEKIVTASLQTLQNLAASWSRAMSTGDTTAMPLLDFAKLTTHFLVMAQTPGITAQRLTVLCNIISFAATGGAYFDEEVLDTLAGLLTAHAVGAGLFDYQNTPNLRVQPPPPTAVPSIIDAISSIVQGSAFRTWRFMLSRPIEEMFTKIAHGDGDLRMMSPKHGLLRSGGSLLPPLHIPPLKNLNYANSFPNSNVSRTSEINFTSSDLDHVNAVVGWLIYFARCYQGEDRLKVLRLIALAQDALRFTADDQSADVQQRTHERVRQIGLLAIPLAVKLVQDGNDNLDSKSTREPSCNVLALLIRSSKELQAVAVEARAIKYVCPILKRSFDTITPARPMWSSRKASSDESGTPASCRLGDRNLPSEIVHAMRCREGALNAIAAMAGKDDTHRKAVVDAGVVNCIVDALKPFEADLWESLLAKKGQLTAKDGNTTSVVLAACNAARSMSRSVSLLRTSLVDAGIAKPIAALLKHPDHKVQVAATDVCTNLLLDFSPMREELITEGVIPVLCEHARQDALDLRKSSLWALKHLATKAPKEVRLHAFEKLGSEFLVNAMTGLSGSNGTAANGGGGVSVHLSSANAAGEQVNLLNPSPMDVDDENDLYDDDDQEEIEDEGEDGQVMIDEASNTHYQTSQLRTTLQSSQPKHSPTILLARLQALEQDDETLTARLDIDIQEQAIDFLRNVLLGDDCALLVDHTFHTIGHQKLFDIITTKLSPLSHTPSGRPIYNPTPLLQATIGLVLHLSGGNPTQKALLTSCRPLLAALLPHFSHPAPILRRFCLEIVYSLTWIEDERDRPAHRNRVQALRDAGVEAKVRDMGSDENGEVVQRWKVAVKGFDGV